MRELILGDSIECLIDHRGKTPKKLGSDFMDDGVPVASALLVKDGKLDLDNARSVDFETFERWMPTRTRFGDVLLTSEAPLGRVARVLTDEPLVLGQRLYGLRGISGVLDSRYLYYALQTDVVQSDLAGRATGTTVVGIRQSALRKVRIPAPYYSEQKAIAEVLGVLDDKIAINHRIGMLSKDLLSVMYANAVADTAEQLHVSLGSLIELNPSERVDPTRSEHVYLDMRNLPDGAMTVSDWSYRPAKGGARFRNGDTLLARITPCLENGKTGYVDFLSEGEVGIGSTEFIVMRPREGIPSVLPYIIATSSDFRDFAIRHMTGTSGRQRLAAKDLEDFEVPVFNTHSGDEFGRVSDALLARVKAAVDETRILARARDELLPLLMSGKLRVRDAEKKVEEIV